MGVWGSGGKAKAESGRAKLAPIAVDILIVALYALRCAKDYNRPRKVVPQDDALVQGLNDETAPIHFHVWITGQL